MIKTMKWLCCGLSLLTLILTFVPALASSPNVQIVGSQQSYGLLHLACDAATSGAVIQAQGIIFVEDLVLDTSTDVTLEGGFDSGFSTQNAYTILQGILTVGQGSLVVDHLSIADPKGTGYSISGTTKTSTGTVIPGVTITLSGPTVAAMATDANGKYSFTGFANGSYTLSASIDGYSFSNISLAVNNADVTGQDFTATPINPYTIYLISATAGYDMIKAFGISDTGVIAGYAHASNGLNHAALWTGGIAPYTLQDLNIQDLKLGGAYAISGSETVGAAGSNAVLWTGTTASTAVNLPVSGVGYGSDVAFGVSGNVIVGRSAAQHAMIWTGSNWTTLIDMHPAGYLNSEALGVSGANTVGDARNSNGDTHAFLWTGTTNPIRHDLTPTGYTGAANAVSGNNIVGVVFNGTANHAALWTGTTSESFVDLHPSAFSSSQALAISGSTAVGYGYLANGVTTHALLWAGSVVDLHVYLSGATVAITSSNACGMNSFGDVVGNGVDSKGKSYIIVWKRKTS
ncbi:MAG: carboxypeptidase regulatory-like domain-containing protein [Desulfuromonadales bacterium]|nr:carboxypeptidase regulatory-like domain-containing protein [Desulfuromonadales bacterium]